MLVFSDMDNWHCKCRRRQSDSLCQLFLFSDLSKTGPSWHSFNSVISILFSRTISDCVPEIFSSPVVCSSTSIYFCFAISIYNMVLEKGLQALEHSAIANNLYNKTVPIAEPLKSTDPKSCYLSEMFYSWRVVFQSVTDKIMRRLLSIIKSYFSSGRLGKKWKLSTSLHLNCKWIINFNSLQNKIGKIDLTEIFLLWFLFQQLHLRSEMLYWTKFALIWKSVNTEYLDISRLGA